MSISENTSKIEQLLVAISALPEAGGDTPTTVEQATPSITVSASGLITASATQTAGYVAAGTKSATKQLTTKAAATYTPTTSNQTISSGRYLTGAQTILGDTNLKEANIADGVRIFGVLGTYKGESGGGGGGGLPSGISALASDTYTPASDQTSKVTVTHNLGVTPNFVLWMAENSTSTPVANLLVSGALYGKRTEFTSNYVVNMAYSLFGYNGSSVSGGMTNSQNNASHMTETQCVLMATSTYKLKAGYTYRWVCGVLDNIS